MATEKIISTRILNKVDTLENWNQSTLALKNGEIAFATVAASAGTGLTEPVVMAKIGTSEEKTFSELPWSFYAKASDVLEAAKDADKLTAFINGVINNAGIASNDAMEELAGRVATAEGEIAKLKGDASTEGSVAKAIKDAIDALDLANTYEVKGEAAKVQTALDNYKTEVATALDGKVAKETGKSLVNDIEITKLVGVSEGANKVEASETNGNIKIDGVETVVYTHPNNHAIADIDGLQEALDGKQAAGNYAAEEHTHTVDEITDFDAKVKEYGYATTTQAQDYADAKDTAIAEAKKVGTDAQDAVDALAGKVGEVDEGKTVVQMIEDAQTSATYDDTQIKADIKANADAIDAIEADYLKAADKEALQTQINTIMNNPDAEGAINSINEFTQYVADHGTIAEGFRTDIDKNKEDIATNAEGIANLSDRMDAAEDAIEAIDNHSHENKTVIDGITSEKVTAWDGAIQTVTAGTGLKATKTGTDIAIELDDEFVFVFDCGTSAE